MGFYVNDRGVALTARGLDALLADDVSAAIAALPPADRPLMVFHQHAPLLPPLDARPVRRRAS